MTATVARGAAFFLGLGFALLPTVGPFLALLFFVSVRLQRRRTDLVWAGAALLYGLAPMLAGNAQLAFSGALQVAAGWLIYRVFAEIRAIRLSTLPPPVVGAGLLSGLALVVALNLFRIEAWNLDTAKTLAQAIVWQSSPSLFGHTVLVLGGLIAILASGRSIRLGALALSALGILVSGSREAAIGWVIVAIVTQLVHRNASFRSRLVEIAAIVLMAAVAGGLGPTLGWGQVGFLLQPTNSAADEQNMLQGTEIPTGDWWDRSWVRVAAAPVDIAGDELVGYRVRKQGRESWLRLQQAIEIEPGRTYTVSAWIRSGSDELRPGIQGWGQFRRADTVESFWISGSLAAEAFAAEAHGPGELLGAGIAARDGPWARVFATFRYDGPEPLAWFVGLAPDIRNAPPTVASFAGFQLQEGDLGPYRPGSATRGLGLEEARLPFWQAAVRGIGARPILGWGGTSYSDWFLANWPGRSRLQVVPAHAHNLFLHVAFERGLVGLLGILLVIAILVGRALARADVPLLGVLAAILFANLFDTTLMYGGVFYPLLAVAGWRAGGAFDASRERSTAARQVLARLALASLDAIAAILSFGVAVAAIAVASPVLGLAFEAPGVTSFGAYAILLWPILSWREGLYPGYGLTPQQELKKQVSAATSAGLVFAAALVVFPNAAALPVSVLLLAVVVSYALLPAARASGKRLLRALDVWGRPLVVLGAGATGRRITRALIRTPNDGLEPIALFDDDPTLRGSDVHGVPVEGLLADAERFATRHGVRHAIVAIPSLDPARLRDLLDTQGRQFRIVQYIPSFDGLPADDVVASNLDGMLAIEVRNNLASLRNRAIKRTMDLVGSAVGLLTLAPVLAAIAIWIRLDSRGPILYRSDRVGQGGRSFSCLKFRTMQVGADARLPEMMASDDAVRDEYERFHKLSNDPRVTRAGRILRTFSLDELPQLLNVFAGEMSLVGPRPYLTGEMGLMDDLDDVILQAKPGMTGHWQVSERNEVGFHERVEMEAHYVRNWSIWWDVVILARTFPAVLEKRGK